MNETSKDGCNDCNKSTLSLLLLRPSPIAKVAQLAPHGSAAVEDSFGLAEGFLPARAPTESRTVLRLLRAGYVYVYIPSPPAGMGNWLVYRVNENADMIPHTAALFSVTPEPEPCSRKGHNKMGMRLIGIPRAAEIKMVWIAYSANLWSDALKTKNAANPDVMQKLPLTGSCTAHTFIPTAENLKGKVLECALPSVAVNNDFPFVSLSAEAGKLADTLKNAAACHPKTKGNEVAVVLADPVAYTAELNALRLRRHELAKKELEKPENAHPLNSSNVILGLKQVIVDSSTVNSYEQVSPLRTKDKFDSETWPAGTEWQILTPEDKKTLLDRASGSILLAPYRKMFSQPDLGRVIYADHDARASAWVHKKAQETWVKLAPHYKETERSSWVTAFENRLKTQHHEPLVKFEEDWFSATQDSSTLSYFKNHFDSNEANKPLNTVCAGVTYAHESSLINQPAPISTGVLVDKYLASMLNKPITDEAAVVQRALVGNQQEVIDVIHAQLTGDSGAEGMRDKNYDFMKGVLGLSSGKAALKKYGWIGDALAMFSVGQVTALSGAIVSAAGHNKTVSAALEKQLVKLQNFWGVQQAIEYAAGSALKSAAPAMPVLITMRVDAKEALDVIRARKGQDVGTGKTRIKKQTKTGAKVSLTLLTDTDALKAAHGDVHKLAQTPASGEVKVGSGTKAVVAGAGVAQLTEKEFLSLYAKQSTLGTKAVNAVRQSLATGSGAQLRAITMSLEGRLAVGSIIVQGIGLVNGVKALEKAGTAKELRDAWYGICDSTAGVMGGLTEMMAVAIQASMVAKVGEALTAKNLPISLLRATANLAGAAGGVVNTVSSWAKAEDSIKDGDIRVAYLYLTSGYMFAGTAVTSGTLALVGVAETLVARGVGGAALTRIAAVGGAEILGLTISGYGLVLLGAGVVFQVGAIAMTPTPMQRWLSRSYFGQDPSWFDWDGKRDDMFAKGDWKAELEALQAAIKEGGQQAEPEKATAPATATATQ
jgi:hypothetical protein